MTFDLERAFTAAAYGLATFWLLILGVLAVCAYLDHAHHRTRRAGRRHRPQ